MTGESVFHKVKQIIVINDALKMSKQKCVFLAGKASVGAFSEAHSDIKKSWLYEARPKLILNAFDESDLLDLLSKAQRRRLPVYPIMDSTHVNASTIACLGIGPARNAEMDELLGVLNFYRWVHENAAYSRLP